MQVHLVVQIGARLCEVSFDPPPRLGVIGHRPRRRVRQLVRRRRDPRLAGDIDLAEIGLVEVLTDRQCAAEVGREVVRSGRRQRVIEHAVIELPALDRTAVRARARLPVRIGPVVGVIVAAEGPVDGEPVEGLPVRVDVAEIAARLPLQLILVEGVERIVEAAAGRECERSRVGEAPRAMQRRRTAEVLLGIEIRRLAQRADADAVDGVAAVLPRVLRLHHLHARVQREVLEQRVRGGQARSVALVPVQIADDEAVLIELADRHVERGALVAARNRQRVIDRAPRLEHLGAVIVGPHAIGNQRAPREEV